MYFFQVYQDSAYQWRWSFIAPIGRKMADSGEGYQTRNGCVMAINTIKREAPGAPIR